MHLGKTNRQQAAASHREKLQKDIKSGPILSEGLVDDLQVLLCCRVLRLATGQPGAV